MNDSVHIVEQPRFSVVMPAFNCERYIGEAIESVIQQSYPALELIVVDDGSTDGTAQVVQHFSKRLPTLFIRQNNQGPSAARNHGVALAQGDWIGLLDADDVWLPTKLLTHRDHIIAHPNTVFFWSDWRYMDHKGDPIRRGPEDSPFSGVIFGHPTLPIPSSVVMRRDVFDRTTGFDQRLRHSEDVEYFARLANRFSVQFITQQLVRYRTHKTQLHLNLRVAADNWPLVNQSLARLWHDDHRKLRALAEHSAMRYTRMGRDFLIAGDYERARHFFRQCSKQKLLHLQNLRRWALSYMPPLRELYRRNKQHAARV